MTAFPSFSALYCFHTESFKAYEIVGDIIFIFLLNMERWFLTGLLYNFLGWTTNLLGWFWLICDWYFLVVFFNIVIKSDFLGKGYCHWLFCAYLNAQYCSFIFFFVLGYFDLLALDCFFLTFSSFCQEFAEGWSYLWYILCHQCISAIPVNPENLTIYFSAPLEYFKNSFIYSPV